MAALVVLLLYHTRYTVFWSENSGVYFVTRIKRSFQGITSLLYDNRRHRIQDVQEFKIVQIMHQNEIFWPEGGGAHTPRQHDAPTHCLYNGPPSTTLDQH